MAADSLKWSPVAASANTTLFNKKVNLTMNARLDPYALNANGSRINTFNINNGGSLFRLTSASISTSYSISSEELNKKDKEKEKDDGSQNNDADSKDLLGGDLTTRNSRLGGEKKTKLATLYQATIPWNLSLRHTFGYSNSRRQNEVSTNSLQFSGSVELSPKWNVGISSGYDFKNKGITPTSLNFERDLDSWELRFNWIPFGRNTTYYFYIGVKAGVLSDLKYDQRRVPDRRLF